MSLRKKVRFLVFNHKEMKQMRRHLGFSMKEFSELMGINVNTYKKMELGEREVSGLLQRNFEQFIKSRQRISGCKLEGKIDYLRVRFKTVDYKTIIDMYCQ